MFLLGKLSSIRFIVAAEQAYFVCVLLVKRSCFALAEREREREREMVGIASTV